MEKREMAADPQGEFTEQVAFYKLKGFSAEEAEMIVKRLTQHPEIYLYEMVRDEFGIDPREAEDRRLARALRDERFVCASVRSCRFWPSCCRFRCSARRLTSLLASHSSASSRVGYYAGTLERAQSDRQGTRSRALRLRRLRDLVSGRALHSAALRPRAGLGRRLMLRTLAHALDRRHRAGGGVLLG